MSGESSTQKISDDPLSRPQLVVFLLLDGWGIAPEGEGNAINEKNSKNFINLVSEYPATVLKVNDLSEAKRYSILGSYGKFCQLLLDQGIRQTYITESEKASAVLAHFVGQENEAKVETKIISSPICDSYNLNPEMSLEEVGRVAVKAIRENKSEFILISVANLDLVSVSGDFAAIQKAVQKVDSFIGKITEEVLLKKGVLVISSAGGNAEKAIDVVTELTNKENTLNPVPFLVVGTDYKGLSLFGKDAPGGDLSLLGPTGNLADIPVTLLNLLKFDDSVIIEGKNLLEEK